jgi:hypothetical protein
MIPGQGVALQPPLDVVKKQDANGSITCYHGNQQHL